MKTLIAVLSILAMPVYAQDMYVGAGANLAYDAFEAGDYDSTNGWDLLAGYQEDRWALEAQIQKLQDFDREGKHDGEIENTSYTVSAKVFPFDGTIEPFLSAGAGLLNSRQHGKGLDTETDYVGVFGTGLDFKINRALTLEGVLRYTLPVGDSHAYDYWTAGANLQFRF